MARLLNILLPTHVKADGDVASGYYIKFFEPDGAYTTLKTVYTDAGATTPASNPHALDASGWPTSDLYGDGLYDIKIYDGDPDNGGNLIKSRLNVGFNNSAVATDLENLVQNGSAEIDDDSDNQPDNWTGSADSGGTLTRDTSESVHGTASFKFVSTTVGSGTYTSSVFEVSETLPLALSFDLKCGLATNNVKMTFNWLDRNQSATSSDVVYNNSTTNPTDWTRIDGISVTPPSGSVYAQLEMDGVANAAAGTTYIDNVVVRGVDASSTRSPQRPRGMLLTRDAGDTSHDINITAGEVRDASGTYNIVHNTEMTKQIDASWAEGDDAGGMDTGAVGADDMYAVWAIASSTKGKSDYLFSTSFTSPTMPAGYDKKQLIGVVWTDSSANLIDFEHFDDMFMLLGVPLTDVADSTITSNTYETGTLRVPPNCVGQVLVHYTNLTTTDNTLYFSIKTSGSAQLASTIPHAFLGFDTDSAADTERMGGQGYIYVDASSQIEYAAFEFDGTATLYVAVTGCRMLTRGNANV